MYYIMFNMYTDLLHIEMCKAGGVNIEGNFNQTFEASLYPSAAFYLILTNTCNLV